MMVTLIHNIYEGWFYMRPASYTFSSLMECCAKHLVHFSTIQLKKRSLTTAAVLRTEFMLVVAIPTQTTLNAM